MMPDINREERRKKRAPVGAFIASSTVVISLLLFPPDWQWVPLAIGTSAAIAVGASIDMVGGRGRGNGLTGRGRGRGTGLTARGRDDDDERAGAPVHQRRMLAMVSLLMPRPAGHRWLAEADGLLSEIAPVKRRAAIRSYLLSAPWLAVMMWTHELQRRARLGPRRPG
jgi:hypothetical protein